MVSRSSLSYVKHMNDDDILAIAKAFKLREEIWDQIDGLGFSGKDRYWAAAGCYYTSLEHFLGIVSLFQSQIFPSALALARPMTEAFIRGAWLHHVADEGDIAKFISGKSVPSMRNMIVTLETNEIFQSGVLGRSHSVNWNLLCGLTHTGIEQVSLVAFENQIRRQYTEGQIPDALRYASAIALFSGMGVALLVDDTDCSSKLLDLAKNHVS